MPVAIITGANTGLGLETARGLAARGFEIVISSREQTKANQALAWLREEFPAVTVSSLPLDLSKAHSIDLFATAFAERFGTWDLLVNNAGAKVLPEYSETDTGVEYHYGVNSVGHFAITVDLLLHRANLARVVSVSSIVGRAAPKTLGPTGSPGSYSPAESYSASKLSNLLFALELERRLGSDLFRSVAAHPGFAKAQPYGSRSTRFLEFLFAQSAANGALPILKAASDQKVVGGSFMVPRVLELWGKPRKVKLPASCTLQNQEENWNILENLSGRKLVL